MKIPTIVYLMALGLACKALHVSANDTFGLMVVLMIFV